ncbi:MAG: hypothetical protein JWN84_226 [Nocardioides sp.]|nr:hypothetical protein [Nocardioides sp.]
MAGAGGNARVVLGALATVLALLATACGSSPAADEPAYGHALVEHRFEKTHVVRLDDGVRLAVGSPDGHRIQVQWSRTGRADGWSTPTTVDTDRLWTHDVQLAHRGGTAAIDPDWWREKELDDDYAPHHTSQVVCRAFRCLPAHSSAGLSGTKLDGAGDFASFGLGPQRVLLWDVDGGFRTSAVTGIGPRATYDLAPDGSFVAAQGRAAGRLCIYDLFVTDRHETRFRRVASSAQVPAVPPCDTASFEVGRDRVNVDVEELSEGIEFRRSGDRWSVEQSEHPLVAYPDTHGRSTLGTQEIDLGDAGTLSIGSPDQRRILVQAQPAGSREWGPPQQVATAPPGTRCRTASPVGNRSGAVVVLGCYLASQSWRPAVRAPEDPAYGLALGTTTGASWRVLPLRDPKTQPLEQGTSQVLVQTRSQTLLWGRGHEDFVTAALPTRLVDGLGVTPDGRRLLRISGNDDARRPCDATLYAAAVTGRRWTRVRTLPITEEQIPSPSFCDAYLSPSDGGFEVGVAGTDGYTWDGRISPRGAAGWGVRSY